jgi:hypothetical protein
MELGEILETDTAELDLAMAKFEEAAGFVPIFRHADSILVMFAPPPLTCSSSSLTPSEIAVAVVVWWEPCAPSTLERDGLERMSKLTCNLIVCLALFTCTLFCVHCLGGGDDGDAVQLE